MPFSPDDATSGSFAAAAGSSKPADTDAPRGFVVERPPPGLARGKYPTSAWTIALLGAALLLVTVGYFLRRWRKLRS